MNFMINILKDFLKKSTNDLPIEFENNSPSICSDSTLNNLAMYYKNGQLSAERCLQGILQHMAYNNNLRIEENNIILNILASFLVEATWKKHIDWDCGDYDPNNPEPWLSVLYTTSIYNDETTNSHLNTLKKIVLSEIKDGTLTPVKIVDYIKYDWYFLCKYQYTYEALEYCIAASENHIYSDDMTNDICNLVTQLSDTYDVYVTSRLPGVENAAEAFS